MTDQSLELPGVLARWGRLRALAARFCRPGELRPGTAWIVVALVAAALLRHFWRDEGEFANILFTTGVTGGLVATLILMSRRAMFAAIVTASLVGVIVAAATAKRATMNMVAHAYDIFFYLSSWSTVDYLWSEQRPYLVASILVVLALALVGWFAYCLDGTRVGRGRAAAMLAACVVLAWCGAYSKGERRHMQF